MGWSTGWDLKYVTTLKQSLIIHWFWQNFANFVDIYHSSKVGIWKTSPGHVDIWLNGGLEPTLAKKAHKSAVDFFAATILDRCEYMAWKCSSQPKWKPFSWKKNKNKDKTCHYGDENVSSWKIGQYVSRDKVPLPELRKKGTNFVVFFTQNFDYCYDWNCESTAKDCIVV